MSLFIASLNSGSNGNCYYVGNENEAVLVDVGISCRETERRMKRLGLPLSKVKAIFISHEHTDHISGVPVLAHKYDLPVYITHETYRKGKLRIPGRLMVPFRAGDTIAISSTLSVMPFLKHHDAADPHSFTIKGKSATVGVFTDIGQPCEHLVHHFRQCTAAFLEANYDTNMLMNGRYPYFLKNRISGGKGHLSNSQALQLFIEHKHASMSHLLLAHLSKENNCPNLVEDLFKQHCGSTEVVIASRYTESAVYLVNDSHDIVPKPVKQHHEQLALF